MEYDGFEIESGDALPLDPFSTSPTNYQDLCSSFAVRSCSYGAPFFAFQREGLRYGVVQGCCNHWNCPRCGLQVAKQHYGRIVEGCKTLSEDDQLWFITITCRGKEVSVEEAEESYLRWTSKFLDAAYSSAKRRGERWAYVQVTEKQKRGHPHSHILTTFSPPDVVEGARSDWRRRNDGGLVREEIPALRSAWLQAAVVSAGLGDQYDISAVRTVAAASRYVAKYMFKPAQFTDNYPKGWKRVRYSQSFPQLPERKTTAFVLLSVDDWRHLASLAAVVDCDGKDTFESASYFLQGSDTLIHERKQENVSHDRK